MSEDIAIPTWPPLMSRFSRSLPSGVGAPPVICGILLRQRSFFGPSPNWSGRLSCPKSFPKSYFAICHLRVYALYCGKSLAVVALFFWTRLIITNLHPKYNLPIESSLSLFHRSALLHDCHLETICIDGLVFSSHHLSIKPLLHLQSFVVEGEREFFSPSSCFRPSSTGISAAALQGRFTRFTSLFLLNLLRRPASPLRSLTLVEIRYPLELAPALTSLAIWRLTRKLKTLSTPLCRTRLSESLQKEMMVLSLVLR